MTVIVGRAGILHIWALAEMLLVHLIYKAVGHLRSFPHSNSFRLRQTCTIFNLNVQEILAEAVWCYRPG